MSHCFVAVDDQDKALEIVLGTPSSNPDASAADKQAATDLLAKGLLARLIFSTDNCDATFETHSRLGRRSVAGADGPVLRGT